MSSRILARCVAALVLSLLCVRGGFGRFGGTQPLVPNDPFFPANNATFPQGQQRIKTTRVDYAWALAGCGGPFFASTDPNRTIAIIDTGIDPNHVEFETSPEL